MPQQPGQMGAEPEGILGATGPPPTWVLKPLLNRGHRKLAKPCPSPGRLDPWELSIQNNPVLGMTVKPQDHDKEITILEINMQISFLTAIWMLN